jgi:hypothetical protein
MDDGIPTVVLVADAASICAVYLVLYFVPRINMPCAN